MSGGPALALKALGPDRWPCHGGAGQWPAVGVWTPTITDLVPGERGWHLCHDTLNLLIWIGPEVWIAEWDGDGDVVDDGPDGMVVSRARLVRRTSWDERAARLWAADCAEHVLPLFETAFPHDDRPRRAIDAARAHARGEISAAAMTAAGDAARHATREVPRDAWTPVWDPARASARVAASAAAWAATVGDTARAAARFAASAAGTPTGVSEQAWQAARLTDALDLTPDEAAVLAAAPLGEDPEVST